MKTWRLGAPSSNYPFTLAVFLAYRCGNSVLNLAWHQTYLLAIICITSQASRETAWPSSAHWHLMTNPLRESTPKTYLLHLWYPRRKSSVVRRESSAWAGLSIRDLVVTTIDNVQGQKYDLTIQILTRAELEVKDVTFLLNHNRLNVMASRPRCGAVLIVDSSILPRRERKNPQPTKLLFDGCRQRKHVQAIDGKHASLSRVISHFYTNGWKKFIQRKTPKIISMSFFNYISCWMYLLNIEYPRSYSRKASKKGPLATMKGLQLL